MIQASIALVLLLALPGVGYAQSPEPPPGAVPTFRVDPDWPEVPAQWKLGEVSSIDPVIGRNFTPLQFRLSFLSR